jgi:hypothetical protein
MTKIFQARDDINTYAPIALVNAQGLWHSMTLAREYFGVPRVHQWPTVSGEFDGQDCKRPMVIGDVAGVVFGIAFSPRAVEIFDHYLRDSGELLPISTKHGIYMLFNCLRVVDSLMPGSRTGYVKDGKISVIYDGRFDKQKISGLWSFQERAMITGWPLMPEQTVVAIRESGITGLKFKQIGVAV